VKEDARNGGCETGDPDKPDGLTWFNTGKKVISIHPHKTGFYIDFI